MKKMTVILILVLVFMFPLKGLAAENVLHSSIKNNLEHEGTLIHYCVILPEGYSLENSYPLMLYLHGEEDASNDNFSQLKNCVQHMADVMTDTIIVAPQCGEGNQWVDVPVGQESYSIAEVPESNELGAVMALLSKLQTEYSMDSDRIYLCGVSMGGYGVWDLMARYPDVFAAGIVFAGAGDPSQAETLKNIPMFVYHGIADDVVSVEASRTLVESIRDVGGTAIRYFENGNARHNIANSAIKTNGVLENLTTYRLSDRYVNENPVEDVEDKVDDLEQDSEKTVKEVEEAEIVKPPSKIVLYIYISVLVVIVGIPVVFIAKKKKR